MAVRALLMVILTVILGTSTGAGPWPRESGASFLSLSNERDSAGNNYAGIYGEYGLPGRRTFGYEIGHTNVGETTALIWFQRSLDDGEGQWRLAYALGGGAISRENNLIPMGQAAFGIGRGLDFWGGGWFAADLKVLLAGETTTVTWRQGLTEVEESYLTPRLTTKGEVTLGFRPFDKTMLIGQLRVEQRQDVDLSAKLAFSALRDLAGPVKLELGWIEPVAGPGDPAMKIGTWIDF